MLFCLYDPNSCTPPSPGPGHLADHEQHARTQLDDNAWAYFSGGAADEISLRANRSAWDALPCGPACCGRWRVAHPRALLGRTLAHPILLAPVAFQRLAHPDGELAMAYAAAALGAGVCSAPRPACRWRAWPRPCCPTQARPAVVSALPAAGPGLHPGAGAACRGRHYEALVLTVDAPTSGVRDRERRAAFGCRPAWARSTWQACRHPPPALSPGQSALFDGLLHHAPTWDDIAWLQSITRLPVLLKGVLHPADARQAVSVGAAGLIVSNHGGRTLDTARPPPPRCPVWCRPRAAGAGAGGRRHPARHRCAQGHGTGRIGRAGGPPCRVGPGNAGRRAWPMCCACCATSGGRHGTDRLRHLAEATPALLEGRTEPHRAETEPGVSATCQRQVSPSCRQE